MFSNITNQFTNLVGAVKGQAEEEGAEGATQANTAAAAPAAAPVPDAAAAAAAVEGAEGEPGQRNPSLVDSLLKETTGWLGSAKGWLGSASIPSMPAMPSMPSMPAMPAMPSMPSIPSIPGLRKGGEEGDVLVDAAGNPIAAAPAAAGDEDDKSRYLSATEGADSLPPSGDEAQLGEEGQIGQGKPAEDVKITTKVTQQAKHFGSFFASAISGAGSKIKETVKKNPIMDSFNKEQEAFIKGQAGGNGQAVAPWMGHPNEAKIKEEIMGLSQDRRNFVRAPPAGIDFEFNYDTAYPTAVAIMAEDKNLETMRFELVPKIITEENFWRNYFYRVSLIIQAAELGTLGEDGVAQASSGEDAKQSLKTDKFPKESVKSSQKQSLNKLEEAQKNSKNSSSNNPNASLNRSHLSSESEFVSDTFETSVNDANALEEIKNGMRILGIDSMTLQQQQQQQQPPITTTTTSSNTIATSLSNDEEQWEKDLEAELKDYEVVDDGLAAASKDSGGGGGADEDDELPTISNMRIRGGNNDLEEFADLIEDTDDLK